MFDYVIVGAGSAGCVLANRLSEDPDATVCLVEAGPPDSEEGLHIPVAFSKLYRTPFDWDFATEPEPALDGRNVYLPRGRVLGGSSSLNAMIYIRGNRRDYDEWRDLGNAGWGWDDVLPYFKRAEDNERGASEFHGAGGPLSVSDSHSMHPLADAFVEAAAATGLAKVEDFNTGEQDGVGRYQVTQRNGMRCSTAVAYLHPALPRPNLTLIPMAVVTRVLFDGGRASGVEAIVEGKLSALEAQREVILCAGAYQSPQLLMLSGIGPADQLRAAGLSVVADVPGVGAEFSDHPDLYVTWQPSRRLPMPRGLLPLATALNTASEGSGGTADLEVMPWLKPFRKVLLDRSSGPRLAGVGEAMRRSAGTLRALRGASLHRLLDQARRRDDLYLAVALQQEESRGRLSVISADPLVQPRLEHRYLTESADRRRLREGVRLAAELLRTSAFAPLVSERTGLPDEVLTDDGELDRWTRRHLATAIHLAGTARMGPDSDPGAVVDQQLRVRGVTGLRIVDTSVMPQVTSRGPAATAVMIGERAAEFMTVG
jgi:choline dehydrogenase